MDLAQAIILLFLVMDPLGNVPIFLSVLRKIEPHRRRVIIIRELVIAFLVLVFFLFFGRGLMSLLQISTPSLNISGGIILFMIALKMIFPISESDIFGTTSSGEPLIVPLAIPLVAGPSAMTTILILVTREPDRYSHWLLALTCAWAISAVILSLSDGLCRLLGERGLEALERLMGMLLTVIAVQMFMTGLQQFLGIA